MVHHYSLPSFPLHVLLPPLSLTYTFFGPSQKRNCPLEIEPHVGQTGFPHFMSVLGTHLYQCTSQHCCERLCSTSVNFLKTLNMFADFVMGDLRAYLPTPRWVLSGFWPKTAWPQFPTFPVHLILPWVTFLFPQMKKVLKGKCFGDVEEVKQKMPEALKGIKIVEFKNCFEQRKKVMMGVLHQMESTLKATEVSTCKKK